MKSIRQDDEELVVWWGTPVETSSVFARLRREGKLTQTDEMQLRNRITTLAEAWTEIVPSDTVRNLAHRLLLRHPLRAADSFQLAAALVWAGDRPEDNVVVCLDGRLRDAARVEGFTVLPTEEELQPNQ
jgi:uncharacterized protein